VSNARIATVTGVNPYQVQFLGESVPLNIAPVVLSTVNTGDYVWCEFFDQQLVVLGRIQDGALPQLGSTEDLNAFVYTGKWNQPLNANTSTAHNYPTLKAGVLEVIRSETNGSMIQQRYSDYIAAEVWWRTYYNGTWEPWTQIGASKPIWTPMTLTNSWANYGAGYATSAYWKFNGIVYVQGLIKSGTVGSGTPFFTFPAGCRPGGVVQFTGNSSGGVADLRVFAGGQAYVYALYSGTNASVSISQIQFPAEN
jgi:hypothetical protein